MKNKKGFHCTIIISFAILMSSCSFLSTSSNNVPSKSSNQTVPSLSSSDIKTSYESPRSSLEETTYTITWTDSDGTVLKQDDVKFNNVPSYKETVPERPTEDPLYYEYFTGWSPDISPAFENRTYVAQYERRLAYLIETESNTSYRIQECYLPNTKNIVVPETYNYGLPIVAITNGAFSACKELETLTVSKNVNDAFKITSSNYLARENRKLKEIIIDEENSSFASIDGVVYKKDLSELIVYPPARDGELVLTEATSKICEYAFEKSNIEAITFPSNMAKIPFGAFKDCAKLEKITTSSITPINTLYELFGYEKPDAHSGKDAYKKYTLPIKELILTDEITKIPEYALNGCANIKTLVIPESVVTLEESSLVGCTSLEKLVISRVYENMSKAFTHMYYQPIHNDNGAVVDYYLMGTGGAPETLETIELTGDFTEIATKTFSGLGTNIKTIIIPDTVTTIGYGAFGGLSRLQNINIPSGLTTISELAFTECNSLKDFVIPETVTSVGRRAFYDCSCSPILIPASLTNIGEEAFVKTRVFYPGDYTAFISSGNEACFSLDRVYFYSETKPTDNGNYWHYVNGKATIWE